MATFAQFYRSLAAGTGTGAGSASGSRSNSSSYTLASGAGASSWFGNPSATVNTAAAAAGSGLEFGANGQDKDVVFHFFKREYSYAVYDNQAIALARKFYRSREVLKCDNGLESLTISRKFFSSIVLALLNENKSVYVWQKRAGSNDSKTGPSTEWVVCCRGSPGHTSELEKEVLTHEADILKESSVVASVRVEIRATDGVSSRKNRNPFMVGIAVLSQGEARLILMDFPDDSCFTRSVTAF
jgi:hypothetical protein